MSTKKLAYAIVCPSIFAKVQYYQF